MIFSVCDMSSKKIHTRGNVEDTGLPLERFLIPREKEARRRAGSGRLASEAGWKLLLLTLELTFVEHKRPAGPCTVWEGKFYQAQVWKPKPAKDCRKRTHALCSRITLSQIPPLKGEQDTSKSPLWEIICQDYKIVV